TPCRARSRRRRAGRDRPRGLSAGATVKWRAVRSSPDGIVRVGMLEGVPMRSGGFPCRFDGCSAQFHVADAKSMESLREASANRTAHEQAAHDYRHPSPPPEMRRQVAAGRAAVGTLVAEDRLVGFAVATPGWLARGATLNNVLIDPAYRGRGLVWPLLAAVERELGTRGFATLVIDARVDNGF